MVGLNDLRHLFQPMVLSLLSVCAVEPVFLLLAILFWAILNYAIPLMPNSRSGSTWRLMISPVEEYSKIFAALDSSVAPYGHVTGILIYSQMDSFYVLFFLPQNIVF